MFFRRETKEREFFYRKHLSDMNVDNSVHTILEPTDTAINGMSEISQADTTKIYVRDEESDLVLYNSLVMPNEFGIFRAIMEDAKQRLFILREQEFIKSDLNLAAYYSHVKKIICDMVIVAGAVRSGYVSVSSGEIANTIKSLSTALSSVLPGTSLFATSIYTTTDFIDRIYRTRILKRMIILGDPHEATKSAEEIARLLVRAHFHAGHVSLSQKQAIVDVRLFLEIIQKLEPNTRLIDKSIAEYLVEKTFRQSFKYVSCSFEPLISCEPDSSELSLNGSHEVSVHKTVFA